MENIDDVDIEMGETSVEIKSITDLDDNTTNANDDNNDKNIDDDIEDMLNKELDNAKLMNNEEERELVLLWEKMKDFESVESGNTDESLHRKHLRFTMEKEFVEMLSNPHYLHR